MLDEPCNLCTAENREHLEEQLGLGILTKAAVGEKLNMKPEAVYDHITNHMVTQIRPTSSGDVPTKLQKIFDTRDILVNNLGAIDEKLGDLLKKDTFSPSDTSQVVRLAAEVRSTVMDLAKLDGQLKQEQHITILQFNELKAVILPILTPEQKQMLLERLGTLSVEQ